MPEDSARARPLRRWRVCQVRTVCCPRNGSEAEPGSYVKQMIGWGAGPRASQQLILASKVRAILHKRTHVTIDDIDALALPVLRHRIVPTFHAEAEGITVDHIVKHLLQNTKRPQASRVI